MEKTKEMDSKFKRIVYEYLPYVILIILVLLMKRFIVSPIKVNGSSMEKTLYDGDIMILNIIGYRFSEVQRFDIVVVDLKKTSSHEYIIKRVIGLPGDVDSRVFGPFSKKEILGKTNLILFPFNRAGKKE